MRGGNVNGKTPLPKRNRITTPPVKRKKSSEPITPRIQQAFGRGKIPKTMKKEVTKSPIDSLTQQKKSIGNISSYPKNIIYYEDEKPITSTFNIKSEEYYKSFISGNRLKTMEDELHLQVRGFDRGSLFFYYCINRICKIGIRMEEFNIKHKNSFPKVKSSKTVAQLIRHNEQTNPHYYESETPIIPSAANQNDLNQAGERLDNMIASFVDSDGILFDDFIKANQDGIFEYQKISSTVGLFQKFFQSAKNWNINDEKFFGLVHPNAEGIEYIGFNDDITPNNMAKNIHFSAIGYGYELPPAYRRSIHRPDATPPIINPHITFKETFGTEILTKLKNSISSNCDGLMEEFNNSPELRNTTYCENQSISAYISKATGNSESSNLDAICDKLEPKMIKNVFMNTNFVTLYRVEKIDNDHVTIVKEILKEPAKESLENKLDEMIARLKN
jgi:hypothetical protein